MCRYMNSVKAHQAGHRCIIGAGLLLDRNGSDMDCDKIQGVVVLRFKMVLRGATFIGC